MKVRNVLIVILACFTIVPTLLYSIITNAQIGSKAESQYAQLISEISSKQSAAVGEYLDSLSRTTGIIAANSAIKTCCTNGEAAKNSDEYAAVMNVFNGYVPLNDKGVNTTTEIAAIYITDASGKIYVASNENSVGSALTSILFPTDSVNTDTVKAMYTDMSIEDNKVYSTTADGNDFILMVTQTVGKGKLTVVFNDDMMSNILSQSSFPTNGRIILIDSACGIIDTTYSGNLNSTNNNGEYAIYKDSILGKNIDPSKKFTYEISRNMRVGYLNTVSGDYGWYVIAVSDASKAFTFSNSAASAINGVSVAIVFLVIAAGIIISFIITKPLEKIEETLIKIRRGDHEARIDVMSKNEYGEIARAFNDLIDDIIVSEGRYRTIIETSDNIIFEWNFKTNEVTFSNNFNKKFSYRAPSDHFGDSFLLKCKVHPEDNDKYRSDLEKLSKGEEFMHNEYRWKNIYGDYIWILMRTSTVRDREGNILKIIGVIVDIDRAKKSEKMLTTRASFDSLTGLYNRETVETAINNEIDLITARKNEFAILFVDIDDFKIYNDKYSHATGDQVLRFTAQTIQNVVEEFGIAGRYGGDEFVICVRNSDINDPAIAAQEILNRLKNGFTCDSGEHLSINVSIGISIIRDDSKRVDEIIGMADDAMYKIKKTGKSSFGYLTK